MDEREELKELLAQAEGLCVEFAVEMSVEAEAQRLSKHLRAE
jgi:hypothetical protein